MGYWSISQQTTALLMRGFLHESQMVGFESQLPQEYESHFGALLQSVVAPSLVGSLQNTMMSYAPLKLVNPTEIDKWTTDALASSLILPRSYVLSTFSEAELSELKLLFHELYPSIPTEQIDLQTTFRKYASLQYKGYTYHTRLTSSGQRQKQAVVFATYCDRNNPSELVSRPVLLHWFVYHTFYVNETIHSHVLAHISSLKPKDFFGKPLELWWEDSFDYNSYTVFNHFIPVQLLLCHSASMTTKYEHQRVLSH